MDPGSHACNESGDAPSWCRVRPFFLSHRIRIDCAVTSAQYGYYLLRICEVIMVASIIFVTAAPACVCFFLLSRSILISRDERHKTKKKVATRTQGTEKLAVGHSILLLCGRVREGVCFARPPRSRAFPMPRRQSRSACWAAEPALPCSIKQDVRLGLFFQNLCTGTAAGSRT